MCHLQHRVTIGLFQCTIMVDKRCCHIGFLYEFLDFLIVMFACEIFRICLNVLFELCKIDLVNISMSHCMYNVPVICDLLTFGLVLCCNIVSVLNLVGESIPSKQRIQSILRCLEWINILLICSAPYHYNSFNQLHLLCSGDIETNPGPTYLKICHINIRSLSPVKLIAIRQEIADKYDIITLSETFLRQETSHNLEIPGFHPIFRRDRGTHGGGVACYVKAWSHLRD